MLADFFTKALQGASFVKFHELIMGWKHIDILQMVPPSIKDHVGNVDEVKPRKEVIESTVEAKDKKLATNKSYADIVIHRNKKRPYARKESSHSHPIQNYNVRTNLYSSNNNATAWSNCKTSNM